MKDFLIKQLNDGLTTLLGLDPDSKGRLAKLNGKTIAVELLPFHLTFYCTFNDHGAVIHLDHPKPPDITLRGTPLQLTGAMLAKNNRHAFFADDLTIEGNASVAQHVLHLFDQLTIDWETIAAKVIGDTPTHHASQAIKRMRHFLKTTTDHLSEDLRLYLHEETNWLPTRDALHSFLNDVDILRQDIDRAEARLHYLASLLKSENTP